jgi:hypothetical protein
VGWCGNRHRPGWAGTRLRPADQPLTYRKSRKLQIETVDNLTDLIARHPATFPKTTKASGLFVPLEIYGTTVSYSDVVNESAMVSFGLSCDIWFPKLLNPDKQQGYTDNSILSAINGKRLNQYFEQVRHATLNFGGKWYYDFDNQYQLYDYTRQINENGIVIT